MDWKDSTISMGLVDKEEFDGTLATVTVSERRITVEPHDVADWERIFRELGEDIVLEAVPWEAVVDVSKTIKDLYYPHINITVKQPEDDDIESAERRIFFTKDEKDTLNECFRSIRRMRNQWRQYKVTEDDRFPDEIEGDTDEEVELQEALRSAAGTDTDEPDEPDEAAAAAAASQSAPTQDESDNDDTEDDQAGEDTAQDQEDAAGEAEAESADSEEDTDDEDDELDDIVDRLME